MISVQTTETIGKYVFWQFALDRLGEAATDLEDIFQSIRIILTTPKGSVPHRPDFAVDLYEYLDKPLGVITNKLVAESYKAVTKFEPRVEVLSIQVEPGSQLGERVKLVLNIRVRETMLEYLVSVAI